MPMSKKQIGQRLLTRGLMYNLALPDSWLHAGRAPRKYVRDFINEYREQGLVSVRRAKTIAGHRHMYTSEVRLRDIYRLIYLE